MYLRILKKDLIRKKTMNIILLIFIVLAATFISSSVNNLFAITTAMESYFEKAGISDFLIITIKDEKNDSEIAHFLNENSNVENWGEDEVLYVIDSNIKLQNDKSFSMLSISMISSFQINQQKFFDSNNNEITQINDNEIYMPFYLMEKNDLKSGDLITITGGDFSMDFTIVDNCKDAFLGSTMMGAARFIVNDNDYMKIKEGTNLNKGQIYSVFTSDVDKLTYDFNQMGFNVIVTCGQDLISMTYVMDMINAGVLLIVSICLIIISLVILRFTIMFTLNEEFREIGVMKAIGMKGRNIRALYIVKYFAISVIGSIIGFLFSIPFGNMFMEKVSNNIIISNASAAVLINLLCSVLIVAIVILFCYTCTRRINKYSPVDAIRNGSNGERFKRKSVLRLSKCNISTVFFMALNNILSEPKKFGVLIITFTMGIILIIVPINTINTLSGDKLVTWFDMVEADVFMVNEKQQLDFVTEGGRDNMKEVISDIEKTLNENGIDASVSCEMAFKFKISYNDYVYNSYAMQGTGITADQYTINKGQAPKYENEVALTHRTADKIGAKIGDAVKIKTGETESEFIVTAIYQSMNNMGEGMRFSEKTNIDYRYGVASLALQIRYFDNPSKEQAQKRFEEVKQLFPDYKIYTGGEYVSDMIGNIAGQMEGIKRIIVVVIIIINMLVAVLMMKTFITKEKGEIAILKSVGFRNSAIIQWQLLRIGIILFISTILGALLSNPLAQISSGQVFKMMGASNIKFEVNALEVYIMYPLFIFMMTMIASGITAIQIKRISSQETNNIE